MLVFYTHVRALIHNLRHRMAPALNDDNDDDGDGDGDDDDDHDVLISIAPHDAGFHHRQSALWK